MQSSMLLNIVKKSKRTQRPVKNLGLSCRKVKITPDNYIAFQVTRTSGKTLALFLEPSSKYGLCRYDKLGLILKSDHPYPILRVE